VRPAGGQFLQAQSVRAGQLTHDVRAHAGDAQRAVGLAGHGGAARRKQFGQPGDLGRADLDETARPALQELLDRALGDEPAAPDDDQPVGGDRHLAHQVTGQEHGASLGGE